MSEEIRFCPQCGNKCSEADIYCEFCGCQLRQNRDETSSEFPGPDSETCSDIGISEDQSISAPEVSNASVGTGVNKVKMIIGIALMVTGVVLLILAATTRFSEEYEYNARIIKTFKENIKDYKKSKKEMEDTADSFGYGFFRSAYDTLAQSYQNLIDETEDDIKEYEAEQSRIIVTSVVLLVAGLGCAAAGVILFLKRKNSNIVSQT